MPFIIDITDQKFGRLIAKRIVGKTSYGATLWKCICECGNIHYADISNLRKGNTKSCGCLRLDTVTKHNQSYTTTYHSYAAMLDRCYNKNNKRYKDWGGRGIKVNKRWRGKNGFNNFFIDMGERPKNKTLNRIKNNKGYSKKNCEWATARRQANKRRNNVLITLEGKTRTMTQWSRKLGLKPGNVVARYYRNRSLRLLTEYLYGVYKSIYGD
jgi:hypothetical protein